MVAESKVSLKQLFLIKVVFDSQQLKASKTNAQLCGKCCLCDFSKLHKFFIRHIFGKVEDKNSFGARELARKVLFLWRCGQTEWKILTGRLVNMRCMLGIRVVRLNALYGNLSQAGRVSVPTAGPALHG